MMYRAIHLSSMAYNRTYPNPRVGAVLAYRGHVIGEGFHKAFGERHAESECLLSVSDEDKKYISHSTLYVTLEPCNHIGKQPPCSDLILNQNIPKVKIACPDPNPLVHQEGIKKLRNAGVEVEVGLLQEEARSQNLYFLYYHENKRPYIILKWAEDANGNIGKRGKRVKISDPETDMFSMRWRSEVQSIMVGKNTALNDNPKLTNRSEVGIDPVRIVIDPKLEVKNHSELHLNHAPPYSYFVNTVTDEPDKFIYKISNKEGVISAQQLVNFLYDRKILVCMIEGGTHLLQHFLDENLFDEIRVIRSKKSTAANIPAPKLPEELELSDEVILMHDHISYYQKKYTSTLI